MLVSYAVFICNSILMPSKNLKLVGCTCNSIVLRVQIKICLLKMFFFYSNAPVLFDLRLRSVRAVTLYTPRVNYGDM